MAETILSKDGQLTEKSDQSGIRVMVCDPGWFNPKDIFSIVNAPSRTEKLKFSGTDLNFAARVLYAEASGAQQLTDKTDRDREKEAILNVKHFRLNRPAYPNNVYIAKTFQQVCEAPGQFESVFANKPKFVKSDRSEYPSLIKAECDDLREAIDAVRKFIQTGPNSEFSYDHFLGYSKNGRGTHIGRSRFWLSSRGKELLEETP